MINYEALYRISYGLFIVCSGDKNHGNGYISNTVFQVTSDPPKFAVCCNKNNYTSEFIAQSKVFSVSILHTDVSPEIFGRFGFKSGRDFDKLSGMNINYSKDTGVPIVLNDSTAYLECRVEQTVDVGTHLVFIGQLVNSGILDSTKEPITYEYYRKVRKGVAPKNAPTYIDTSKLHPGPITQNFRKYECAACGFIYDEALEGMKFKDLPEDWVCPSCGSPKEVFFEIPG